MMRAKGAEKETKTPMTFLDLFEGNDTNNRTQEKACLCSANTTEAGYLSMIIAGRDFPNGHCEHRSHSYSTKPES